MSEAGDSPDCIHLKQYGYAPGHYMNKCYTCEKVVADVDKRAICCRPCAEEKHRVNEQQTKDVK